jgi:hypothetical protein
VLLIHQLQRSVRFRFWRNSHSSSSSLVKVHHSLVRARARADARARDRTNRGSCCDRLRPPTGLQPARTTNDRPKSRSAATRTFGGAEETRTPDFLLAKEALYQLSYGPAGASRHPATCDEEAAGVPARAGTEVRPLRGFTDMLFARPRSAGDLPLIRVAHSRVVREWAFLDSNQRPLPYQGSALTS